ncbi:MAG: CheY-like chemotaxis protein, partial [Bacteriovoracaceae bacterium]
SDTAGNKSINSNIPTVLIVDDDENVREIVVESLEDYNINVIYAKSGLEAVFMVKKYPVNVVLTDLRMPEIDGLKLSQMISSTKENIDIVLMSGTIFELPEEVRKKFNIHSLITKPFNVIELSENLVSIAKKNFEHIPSNVISLNRLEKVKEAKKVETNPHSARILFVDDAVDMHMLFKVMMKKYPIEVDYCENGEEALLKFKENRYDLVLMDVNMPVMDGKTAIKLMREFEINSNLDQVVSWAITANSRPEDIEELLQYGFSDYMGKPLKKEKIIQFLIPEEKAVKSS